MMISSPKNKNHHTEVQGLYTGWETIGMSQLKPVFGWDGWV
jgi:hypothetical protein